MSDAEPVDRAVDWSARPAPSMLQSSAAPAARRARATRSTCARPTASARALAARRLRRRPPVRHPLLPASRSRGLPSARRHAVARRRLVAVHPDACVPARADRGRRPVRRDHRPGEQVAVASSFMEQMARLHGSIARDARPPRARLAHRVTDHVHAELDEWEAQYRAHDEPEPLLALALAWLRTACPTTAIGRWSSCKATPGRATSCTPATRSPRSPIGSSRTGATCTTTSAGSASATPRSGSPIFAARFRDYERFSGRRIDPDRLRYFRVLAQTRCAIGTRRGLLARDHRAEMAAHLIFNTLHQRLLAEALAEAEGLDLAPTAPLEAVSSETSWAYDVALDDLRAAHRPAARRELRRSFARKDSPRLLKYLREQQRLGPAAERAEPRGPRDAARPRGRRRARRTRRAVRGDRGRVGRPAGRIPFCRARADWTTQIVGPAMGALADRHYAPISDADR